MRNLINQCLLIAFLMMAGCQKRSASANGTAVIDLDKVAKSVGWMDEMSKTLQTADAELKTQLDGVLRDTLRSIEEVKKKTAADAKLTAEQIAVLNAIKEPQELDALPLSKEQRETIIETVRKANVTWQEAFKEYQQALQVRQATLIQNYRDRIRPTAGRVAASRGLTVVLITSPNLLYFDPDSADITDRVIDELQKDTLKNAAPPSDKTAPITPTPKISN